jgi:aminopeptidase N
MASPLFRQSTPHIVRRVAPALTLVLVAVTLFVGLLVLSACGRDRERTPAFDPYAQFRPAMKSEYQDAVALLEDAPRYAMQIELDTDAKVITGTAKIDVTNYSQDHWTSIVFRLYPTLKQYGGNFLVRSASVDGQPVSYGYVADNTAIRVDLAEPLPPGEATQVRMNWRLDYPVWSDNQAIYALFGESQGMTALPLFYPSLAVYEDGELPGTGDWWDEIGSVRGDAAYNVTSLFAVTATMPAAEVPVTSGTLVTSTLLGDGRAQHVWVTGPSREFVLHTSPLFQQASVDANGTQVTSYWLPGQESGGRAALRYAAAALRIYSQRFADYPFRDMRIAPAPINYRGMEYPQVSLLGIQIYDRYFDQLEMLAAHEVAHQWWYQMVHNDPVNAPWLDESLAEYSMRLYTEDLRGEYDADAMTHLRWQIPLDLLQEKTLDAPIDLRVDDYVDGAQYETVVYGKGALFYDVIRERIGDRRFDIFLQDYLVQNMWGVVDTDAWLRAVENLEDPALLSIFQSWSETDNVPVFADESSQNLGGAAEAPSAEE